MPFMPLVTTQCHDMVFIVGIFKTPICFTEDLSVTLQQIGNDDVRLFERQDDVASVAYCDSTEASGNTKRHFTDRERLPR